ncbi:hypothetical protein [Wenxinia marina]|nr:hypothetical protein [Wenxinia marina]GGL63847.1 hypothetical protein GCM10011392_18240 [Wenxinia marina]
MPLLRPAALAVCLALLPAAAPAFCFLGCDEESEGAEAAAAFAAALGFAAPEGVEVQHHLDGGFQDAFFQSRLAATPEGLATLGDLLGADLAALPPAEDTRGYTDADWWPEAPPVGLTGADISLPGWPYAAIRVAPDPDAPGALMVLLSGNET